MIFLECFWLNVCWYTYFYWNIKLQKAVFSIKPTVISETLVTTHSHRDIDEQGQDKATKYKLCL